MRWPEVQLRRISRLAYGDSLAESNRNDGLVPIYGSNGRVGRHDVPNTTGPVIIVGRKGSFGKVQFDPGPVFAIDTTFFVDETQTRSDLRWLYYALGTLRLDELSEDVGVPGLSREKVYERRVPVPPPEQQRVIADYLDRETARIDALTAARRRQLELLKVRRLSVAQETIDRSSPQSVPLRRVVRQFVDYRGATPEKANSGVRLITASNVSGGIIDLGRGKQFVSEDVYWSWMRRGFPESGDVLLTTEAPLGEVAAIEDPHVALAQRVILLKPERGRIDPEYLRLSLMSPVVQADLLSRASGSTVWGIRADRLRDVLVPVPELSEQRAVVAAWLRAERLYVSAREQFQAQLRLLAERRQAVITAAVSGQIRVPVAA